MMPIRGLPKLQKIELPNAPAPLEEGASRREQRAHKKESAAYEAAWAEKQAAEARYTDAMTGAVERSHGNPLAQARTERGMADWIGTAESRREMSLYKNPAEYIQDAWATVLPTPEGPKTYLADDRAGELLDELAANNGSAGPKVRQFLQSELDAGHISKTEAGMMQSYLAPEAYHATIDALHENKDALAGRIAENLVEAGVPETAARSAAMKAILETARLNPAEALTQPPSAIEREIARAAAEQNTAPDNPTAQTQVERLKARINTEQTAQGPTR